MTREGEDDWEYEYDENETEDFYITLDLSYVQADPNAAHVPGFLSSSQNGHPGLQQSKLRPTATAEREPEDTNSSPNPKELESMGDLQIINLHTQNPLVVYNDQVLSCKWASTIGTDMFFVKPESDAESGDKPLRSLPAVDLLAMSSTKLMAKIARLQPHDRLFEGPESPAVVDDIMTGVERPQATEDAPRAPSTFLAKLNEAKAKRGDKTRLEVFKNDDGTVRVAATELPQRLGGHGRKVTD